MAYGGGHINMMYPIAKEIEQRGDLDFQIIALNTAIPYMRDKGLPYQTLLDYLPDFPEKDRIEKIGKILADKYHNSAAGFSYEQSVAYMGLSMWDLIHERGEQEAYRAFAQKGRHAFLPINVMKRIIQIEVPDCIVISVPFRMEAAAVIVGNGMGIPTIEVHDLHFVDKPISEARYHFVLSNYAKKNVMDMGLSSNNIFITGNPAMDLLDDVVDLNKGIICETLGLDPMKKIVLWATTPFKVATKGSFEETATLIHDNSDLQFIVKLHPGEDNIKVYEYLCQQNSNTKLVHFGNNLELLHIADLLLTEWSTMALEASYMGKNVVNIDLPNQKVSDSALVTYDKCGISVAVKNSGELSGTVRQVLFDAKVQEKLNKGRKLFWDEQGKAANKIYKIIKEIMD